MAEIWIDSPLGAMRIVEADGAICALDWGREAAPSDDVPVLHEAARQLSAYLPARARC